LFENLVDENAMECLLERADPAAEDSFRQEKLGVERRIESLFGALARETKNQDFVNLVRRLLDFLQMAGNMDAVHPVTDLLNECERILEERNRRQRRLQELKSVLADELEQTAASLRHTWCGQEENRQRLLGLQNALASLESVRQEISEAIREMAMLEAQLQQRLSDFLLRHANPPVPASEPLQKKRRRAPGS
jgi:septation ring formation regulator EzrA